MAVSPAIPVCGMALLRTMLRSRGFAICSKLRGHEPSLLLKLKSDLKAALRAKDSLRLNVIRGSLSEINNVSKTSNSAATDERILAILSKQAKESKKAAEEFEVQKRPDLSEQEVLRVGILENYLNTVERFSEEDISKAVVEAITVIKAEGQEAKLGQVMKRVKASLKGKALDMEKLVETVRLSLVG